nr:2-isopropylmalate synthase [Nocardioides sp.]
MPFARYRRDWPTVEVPDRTWPAQRQTTAPLWCSVDLRDGNQALPKPMDQQRKLVLFNLLVEMGFKEVEVGYPSASQTEFDFVRHLITHDLIPDDVTISVFTPARPELIERTMDSVRGAKTAMIHLCAATAPLWRRVVFDIDQQAVLEMTIGSAVQVLRLADSMPTTRMRFQYSPEVFNLTEPEFALRVCNAVTETWSASADRPVTINLPTTVEASTPDVFADQVEWMHRRLERRDAVILSLHPHNDRGTAVATAELGLAAGADRVEGCLFGNGERTGNVCLATMALNLFSVGVDPQLDLSDIDSVRRTVEECTQIPVSLRHPYAGDYVYTAFSGTHQDAINKGLRAIQDVAAHAEQDAGTVPWDVPYLPIDPKDVGRNYESVIRVNSQSGKGGVAYVLASQYGLQLPRGLQVELSRLVQAHADIEGDELTSKDVWELFAREFMHRRDPLRLVDVGSVMTVATPSGAELCMLDEQTVPNLLARLENLGCPVTVKEQSSHVADGGARPRIAAYTHVEAGGRCAWGAALNASETTAAVEALLSAINRAAAVEVGATAWFDALDRRPVALEGP